MTIENAHKFYVQYVTFDSQGKYILSSGGDNFVKTWEKSGNLIRSIDVTGNIRLTVNCFALSTNGKYIALCADNDNNIVIQ